MVARWASWPQQRASVDNKASAWLHCVGQLNNSQWQHACLCVIVFLCHVTILLSPWLYCWLAGWLAGWLVVWMSGCQPGGAKPRTIFAAVPTLQRLWFWFWFCLWSNSINLNPTQLSLSLNPNPNYDLCYCPRSVSLLSISLSIYQSPYYTIFVFIESIYLPIYLLSYLSLYLSSNLFHCLSINVSIITLITFSSPSTESIQYTPLCIYLLWSDRFSIKVSSIIYHSLILHSTFHWSIDPLINIIVSIKFRKLNSVKLN